ncbi:MAG: hypothetical protein A2648_01125 [Candidatus Lloydbacteria bacterium RIFCSPHIGHO2_01_FULL_41_20]|uniref:LysM domain-containing protein n=1 Tax=Candidatus Lloydbacteria bacterium RIFCSPHIGHO2_01_FULL_41_20 TaxID=1798657 RepID=A0A1G2CUH0_9BACT|nr:MAG: hypothetical protein A2648_01125 [Candidatus Lloydbacteria bacterium RIFCSPHIGHO2_01_FULL_41_20]
MASFIEGLLGRKTIKDEKNSQNIPLLKANLGSDQGSRGGGDINIVDGSAIMADTGPLGTSLDLTENQTDEISIYVVRKGDSISQIAKMFGVSANTIIWANSIEGGIIGEGQKLIILPVSGIQYTIKAGDTIKKITDKYKADAGEIMKFNGISLDTKLVVGEIIIIPDAEGAVVKQSINLSTRPTSRVRGTGGPSYDGYYIRPINGGYRSQGLHGYNGVDLANLPGTPVVASAAGDVIISRQGGWNGGYGNYIVIQHDNGTQTLYAHLKSNVASVGWHVAQGQVIAYLGNTGQSTGPHVHFEVRGAQNPY